ncbi:Importin alpha subunit (Karyopherin alpha subunit) (Serine-rich RNA polymerase I suppressor protein) [Actinomortierella wolfii]|nr:Importin alpha subunit (Karyopherin alpha subunit) (Serine-rich RNA polymerase I suppressor protein) [Actinomortierella wolfii]
MLKLKSATQRDYNQNVQDDEEDLIEQLNRKLSNVTLNPTTPIPDEMNMADISTMACTPTNMGHHCKFQGNEVLPTFAQPLRNLLASGDLSQQLLAMVRIRKYLSLQDVLPRIDNVLALDCIPYFISFLNRSDCPDLQYETAWVVTNIAAGSTAQTERLVQAGILKPLIHNLRVSTCVHVQTQTIWALGNISGDGPPYRDLILRSGALEVILQMIEMCEDPSVAKEQKYMILRIAVWCVSNLCRGSGRAAPQWLQVTPAFPLLRRLMYIDDAEILADTCWAMCRILNGTHKMNLEHVTIDLQLCARFVELLHEPHPTIQVPSLRSLINIASGPHDHTQLLIDAKAIPVLGSQELLAHRNSTIRRDALLGISNITAGTLAQVWAVSKEDNGNVMRRVLEILRRGDIEGEDITHEEGGGGVPTEGSEGGDWRVLREAAWVISNATSVLDAGVTGQMVYEMELLPSLAQLMDPRHPRKPSYLLPPIGLHHPPLLTKLLDIVFNVLRCNEHHPREQFMKMWVVDYDGGQILLELLKLANPALRESSVSGTVVSNGAQRADEHGNDVNKQMQQHVRFGQDGRPLITTRIAGSTNGGWVESVPLGTSVKKRIETILETFFEFGPENDGFGPFFGERASSTTEGHRGGQSAFGDGYGSDYFDDDDDGYQDGGYQNHDRHPYSESVDIEIEEMERQVGRMNLF